MISEQLDLRKSPKQMFGVSDSHARTSVWPESRKDLPEDVVVSFSQLQALLETSKKKISPATYSLRTLRTYLALMGDGTSPNFSLKWMKSATMSNGMFSIQPKSCLNTVNESLLSDILEDEVPEKYFLSRMAMKKLLSGENKLTPLRQDTEKLKEQDRMLLKVNRRKVKQVGNISNGKSFNGNPQVGRVYDPDGIAPSLNIMQGGGREPKIIQRSRGNNKGGIHRIAPTISANSYVDNNMLVVREPTKKGYAEATVGDSINISHPNSKTRRGRVGKGVANTLQTGIDQGVVTEDLRIRKLTPRECWRLQGFPAWAFDKAQEVNSNSQLYKQAGNSVTVPVIYEMAKRMEIENDETDS